MQIVTKSKAKYDISFTLCHCRLILTNKTKAFLQIFAQSVVTLHRENNKV